MKNNELFVYITLYYPTTMMKGSSRLVDAYRLFIKNVINIYTPFRAYEKF